METFGIVVHFDILKYLAAGIFGRLESSAFQHLCFKPAEEGFHVHVVIGIVGIAHTLQNFVLGKYSPKIGSGILELDKSVNIKIIERQTLYVRIVVNKSKSELGLKRAINKDDWNPGKGFAKPKTPELKELNSYLEEVRVKRVTHYQRLDLDDEYITAEAVKKSYLGLESGVEEEKK